MALGKAIASGATAAALTSNPIGWAVGGAMLASSLFGGKAKKEAAGEKMGYIQEQMSGFQDQLASIPGLVTDKTKMAHETNTALKLANNILDKRILILFE